MNLKRAFEPRMNTDQHGCRRVGLEAGVHPIDDLFLQHFGVPILAEKLKTEMGWEIPASLFFCLSIFLSQQPDLA